MKHLCARHGALALLALVVAGCAGGPPRAHPNPSAPLPPSPTTVLPSNPPNINEIPDAVPRLEPRSQYGNPPFYVVAGRRYVVLPTSAGYIDRGVASWYGTEFHGLRTSTGEPYDMFAMTAAHKTLPLPCYARVTNLANGRSVVVRINDRGPFVANRIIDLSYSAARKLDMIRNGTAFVQIEVLTPAAPVLTAQLPVSVPAINAASAGVSTVPPVIDQPQPQPTSPPTPPPAPSPGSAPASAPVPVPAAQAPLAVPPAAAPTSMFYIQVGAYSKAQNAESVARKLRASGIAQVMTLAPAAGSSLQRVRIGPIASVQQFDALIARLQTLGFPDARLAQD